MVEWQLEQVVWFAPAGMAIVTSELSDIADFTCSLALSEEYTDRFLYAKSCFPVAVEGLR